MKIVINSCFGGFGLSAEAEELYAKKSGFEIFRYQQTKYRHRDGVDEYVRAEHDDSMFCHTYTKDHGKVFNEHMVDRAYWSSRSIERTDPVLIEVVEELGEAADGMCASLEIIEIPDGVEYEISEYDGNEHVAEAHRTWD